jgi:diguanylate cyclase (GGDEF)-like protein/PAS domain S-box-containing protein
MTSVPDAPSDFRSLYLNAPCGLLTMSIDGIISEVNDTLLMWLGYDRGDVIGTNFMSHLDPGSQLFYETRHMPVLRLEGVIREVSLRLNGADERALTVLLNAEVQDVDSRLVIHTAVFDATSRQEYEREILSARRAAEASEARVIVLQEATSSFAQSSSEQEVAEALYAAAVDAFSATATGVFLAVDGGFELLAGDHPLDGLIPPDAALASNLAIEEGMTLTVTSDDDSGTFPFLVAGLIAKNLEAVTIIPLVRHGLALGVLACFFELRQDFDDQYIALQASLARQASQAMVRVRLQQELERLALHDQLTGLANREVLQQTVASAVQDAVETGNPLSVIFLDLDGFKGINDDLGHVVGDAVLREVSDRIRKSVRQQDTVGRYGGDEFVVVCEAADEESAHSIAERIRQEVDSSMEGIDDDYSITASVGVLTWIPVAGSLPSNDELLSLADTAMYAAKSSGKNLVVHARR